MTDIITMGFSPWDINMKEKILIIAFLCAQFVGFSQWRKVERLERDRTPSLKLSYNSKLNFSQPGLKVGAEFMMRRKTVTIKNFTKTKEKSLVANLFLLRDPDLSNVAAMNVEWQKRTRYGNSGFFTETAIGAGVGSLVNRSEPTTYVKNTDGTETVKSPKNFVFMVNLNVGLGYDFMQKMEKPIKAYARIGYNPIYLDWLYNDYLKSEIGVVTSLSAFKRK
jgi:hypothetical protein